MPEYIAKFLAIGIRLLLKGKGQEFLNEYYSYVEKIYNYQIPLRDIATKGKIKKSIFGERLADRVATDRWPGQAPGRFAGQRRGPMAKWALGRFTLQCLLPGPPGPPRPPGLRLGGASHQK